jgi:plastocyanin
MRRLLILATAMLTALAIGAGSAAAQTPTLIGTVGPGFTITLTQNGKAVKSLKAGTYRIRVTDKASDHDFVLTGPGVTRSITGLSYKGTKTMRVTLRKGTYTYFCTPHKSMMQGSFKVT